MHLALIKLGRAMLLGAGRTLENNAWRTNYTPKERTRLSPPWNVPFIPRSSALCLLPVITHGCHLLLENQQRCRATPTSKLLLIMPSDLPTERRTSYWQCRCQRTVLPRGKSNNNNKLWSRLRWTQAAAAPPFINLASALPFVEAVFGCSQGGRAEDGFSS